MDGVLDAAIAAAEHIGDPQALHRYGELQQVAARERAQEFGRGGKVPTENGKPTEPTLVFHDKGFRREQWDVLESPEGDECWLLVLREESDRGGRIITPVYEIFLWLAPAAGAVIGAPFVQTLASRAGDSAFAFLRDRFQRHRRTRDHPPDMQILIARSLDNRMTLEIPGDITEEALQAFIDQVPVLLADAPGVEDIRIGLRDGRRWERREG